MQPLPQRHTPADNARLTTEELERLATLEQTVSAGLETFLAVGRAFLEIREHRLFRASHPTFKAYAADRWGYSEARAHSLMYSAQVVGAIEAEGLPQPTCAESAVRELMPLLKDGPEAVAEAWRVVTAQHDGAKPPSAAKVRAILIEQGLVARPARNVADELQRRLTSLETCATRIEGPAHESLRPVLGSYAKRCRKLADQLDAIATAVRAPLPPDELCDFHGRHRDANGICTHCRRPDLPRTADRGRPADRSLVAA